MATRTSERKEAAYAFVTRYDALNDLKTDAYAQEDLAALLVHDPDPAGDGIPSAILLDDAKTAYDTFLNNATYEGCKLPSAGRAALWAELKAEAQAQEGIVTSDHEKMEAYHALMGRLEDLEDLNTDVRADSDISTLMAIDLGAATPTAVQLQAARTAWDGVRAILTYKYGGIELPAVNVNGPLWLEIQEESAA